MQGHYSPYEEFFPHSTNTPRQTGRSFQTVACEALKLYHNLPRPRWTAGCTPRGRLDYLRLFDITQDVPMNDPLPTVKA